jgi:hypothetical protein
MLTGRLECSASFAWPVCWVLCSLSRTLPQFMLVLVGIAGPSMVSEPVVETLVSWQTYISLGLLIILTIIFLVAAAKMR